MRLSLAQTADVDNVDLCSLSDSVLVRGFSATCTNER